MDNNHERQIALEARKTMNNLKWVLRDLHADGHEKSTLERFAEAKKTWDQAIQKGVVRPNEEFSDDSSSDFSSDEKSDDGSSDEKSDNDSYDEKSDNNSYDEKSDDYWGEWVIRIDKHKNRWLHDISKDQRWFHDVVKDRYWKWHPQYNFWTCDEEVWHDVESATPSLQCLVLLLLLLLLQLLLLLL